MKQIASAVFIIIFIVGFVFLSFTFQQVEREKSNLVLALQRRTTLLSENAKDSMESYVATESAQYLPTLVNNFVTKQRIAGVFVFSNKDVLIASSLATTSGLPNTFETAEKPKMLAGASMDEDTSTSDFQRVSNENFYIFATPLHDKNHAVFGSLVLVQNASYIDTQIQEIWKNNALWLGVQIIIVSLAVIFIILWIIYQPINNLVDTIKKARTGKLDHVTLGFSGNFFFQPVMKEITKMTRSLREARTAANQEARLRVEKLDSPWTSERLKAFTQGILKGKQIFVVSNREPYIHTKQNGKITYYQPASGMVTAIEPIMRACGGLWIAHGAGNADRETVNENNTVAVPPDDPKYSLRRVWLSPQEEKGYYNGFSNEGIWPLCHMAHTRPIFRKEDWEEYKKVNGKFAEVLLKEIKSVRKPIILIQDYHFAMLPRIIKNARPDAIIGIFWHIPWPNSENFRICPWRKELLDGMLGADLLGFHTQLHCNNFIDTVGRELEALINLEQFAVQRKDHISYIKPFPISIPFSEEALTKQTKKDMPPIDKKQFLKNLGITTKYIGLGVDRLDYTKGIIERLHAVEYFLKTHPSFKEQFTFIQIAAPSRSTIPHYYQFEEKVEKEVQRINEALETHNWKPIVLLKKHHSHDEINKLYKITDVCVVTSLHDGMNLVAKEFIMARTDEKGVLILSQFAGASQELKDALIVNPYSSEQTGESIYTALTMMQAEQTKKMKRLREIVINFNVYRWSADLLKTLVSLET